MMPALARMLLPALLLALPAAAQSAAALTAVAQSADAPDAVAADSLATPSPTARAAGTVWEFLGALFGLSAGNLEEKLLRIAVIAAIVVIAKLFLTLVQTVSRWAVYAEQGPFKYIFRNHQRSITIHALVISLTKYIVYFMALGYVLAELGVDYKTYLASLSLIGIAIGFGSQGLVQDVVTGFFILFENQFSVGDMVEVSGQVGVVETIGMRTTRIRNYFGASIVLQNRNIPMAARYPAGAFQAVVDVALPGPESADAAASLLLRLGNELRRQFHGVVLGEPASEGLVQLATGESFARLRLNIWPAQQWLVDAQLVPRLKELFQREGLTIPGDRVVVFYHVAPEPLGSR